MRKARFSSPSEARDRKIEAKMRECREKNEHRREFVEKLTPMRSTFRDFREAQLVFSIFPLGRLCTHGALYADEGGCTLSVGREVKLEIPASFFPTAGQQGLVIVTFA